MKIIMIIKRKKDPILNSLVINIDDFPKINKEENKFIRVLFVVQLLPKMYYDDLKSRAKIKVSLRNEWYSNGYYRTLSVLF